MKKRASGPAGATTEPRKAGKAALVKKRSVVTKKNPTRQKGSTADKPNRGGKKKAEDRIDRETLEECPKKIVCQLLGRVSENGSVNNKVVDGWVTAYGMPAKGDKVNLFVLMKWFGDRLAKFGRFEKTLEDDADEEGNDDGDGEGLQAAYIRAKTIKAREDTLMQRVKREKLQEELVVKEIVHASLARLSDRLRAAGERCRARWGDDAVALFDDLQAGFALDIDQVCSEDEQIAVPSVSDEEPANA